MTTNTPFDQEKFVNRREEIELILNAIQQKTGKQATGLNGQRIKFLVGGIGQGKTWLLKQIQVELNRINIDTKLLDLSSQQGKNDGVNYQKQVSNYLQEIIKEFDSSRDLSGFSLQELSWYLENVLETRLQENPIWVLLIDNVYSPNWELLREMEDYIFGPLSTQRGVAMIFTGNGRAYTWKTPELQYAEYHELKPFKLYNDLGEKEIENQILKLRTDLPEEDIRSISLGSGGIPGLITYLAKFGKHDGYRQYLQDILRELGLQEDDEDLKWYLRCFSYLPYFTDSHISAISAMHSASQKYGNWQEKWREEMNLQQARNVREHFVNLGILIWSSERSRFMLDDLLRRLVQGSLNFEDWNEVRRRVSALYDGFWEDYKSDLDGYEIRVQSNYPAKKTKLVNYEYELETIQAIIEQKQTGFVYVYGLGGTGKTRIVEEIIGKYKNDTSYFMLDDVVDLFHPAYQQPTSFQEAISSGFIQKYGSDNLFEKYSEELSSARAEYIKLGSARILSQEMVEIWEKEYRELEAKKMVILVLDTAEKLFYPNPVTEKLNLEQTDSLHWFFESFVPKLTNTIVIMSGRLSDSNEYVKPFLEEIPTTFAMASIELKGFRRGNIDKYWENIKEANADDVFLFKCLDSVTPQDLSSFYEFYLSQERAGEVNPLALAVLVDLSIFRRELFVNGLGNNLAASFQDWLFQNELTLSSDSSTVSPKVLTFLVHTLMKTDFESPQVLQTIARARKGVDETLFLALSSWDEKNRPIARRLLSSQFIENLSIIKLHPRFRRSQKSQKEEIPVIYLHDAVYEQISARDAESQLSGRHKDFTTIDSHYKREMKNTRNQIAKLFFEAFSTGKELPDDVDKIFDLINKWDELAADRVYYALDLQYQIDQDTGKYRYVDIQTGFATFYQFAEEALASQDKILDKILEAELLAYWYEHKPALEKVGFDKLLIADLAVRSIKRRFYLEASEGDGDFDEFLRDLKRGGNYNDLIVSDRLAEIDLAILEALYKIYGKKGDMQVLHDTLRSILEKEEHESNTREVIILARANNIAGFLYRTQGQLQKALLAYQQSIHGWRLFPELESEQSNTITNAAFVLAELGRFNAAIDWGVDAKNLRIRRGILPGIGQAYNVLGHIYLRQGLYEQALTSALTAQLMLGTASQEKNNLSPMDESSEPKRIVDPPFVRRMQGLNANLLAECYRRMAGNIGLNPRISDVNQSRIPNAGDLLELAISYSDVGFKIFQELDQPEGVVEALIERGCAFRDLLLINKVGINQISLITESELVLSNAIRISEEKNVFSRKLDAKVNLVWLYYDVYLTKDSLANYKDLDKAQQQVEEFFNEAIVRDYMISPTGIPRILDQLEENVSRPVFALLGKISLVQGLIEYYAYKPIFDAESSKSNVTTADLLVHAEKAIEYISLLPNTGNMVWLEQLNAILKYEKQEVVTLQNQIQRLQAFGKDAQDEQLKDLLAKSLSSENVLMSALKRYYGFRGVEHFCLSLEYNIISEKTISRDLSRAMSQIHEKLKEMTKEELAEFMSYVYDFQDIYGAFYGDDKLPYILNFLEDRLFIFPSQDEHLENTVAVNGSRA